MPRPDVLASAEARNRGAALFLQHCALCHGEQANGLGPRRNLSQPAADLTDPRFHAGARPEDVFCIIREGVPETPMAAWKVLDDDETWALVAFVLAAGASA